MLPGERRGQEGCGPEEEGKVGREGSNDEARLFPWKTSLQFLLTRFSFASFCFFPGAGRAPGNTGTEKLGYAGYMCADLFSLSYPHRNHQASFKTGSLVLHQCFLPH